MYLVIAEKPSVAQSIAAILGAKQRRDGFLEGCGSPVETSVRSTEAPTEPAGETEQQPVGMGVHRGTAFHLAHDFACKV